MVMVQYTCHIITLHPTSTQLACSSGNNSRREGGGLFDHGCNVFHVIGIVTLCNAQACVDALKVGNQWRRETILARVVPMLLRIESRGWAPYNLQLTTLQLTTHNCQVQASICGGLRSPSPRTSQGPASSQRPRCLEASRDRR